MVAVNESILEVHIQLLERFHSSCYLVMSTDPIRIIMVLVGLAFRSHLFGRLRRL